MIYRKDHIFRKLTSISMVRSGNVAVKQMVQCSLLLPLKDAEDLKVKAEPWSFYLIAAGLMLLRSM